MATYRIIDLINNEATLLKTTSLTAARKAEVHYGEDTVEIRDNHNNRIIVKGIDAHRATIT